jgi:pimeloyl-ACP methyl ester carboxylesterase
MSEYLELSQGLIHWKDYGGTGKTILGVHGLGGSLANWDAIGPRLARYGHTVAIDLPGFGLSPPGPDWSLETHAAAVADAICHFGPPAVLIGNSMGGLISKMVAASHPELVTALVLIAPATPPRLPDPNITWPVARRALIGSTPGIGPLYAKHQIASMSSLGLVNEWLARITHKPSRVPLEIVEALVKLAERRRSLPWSVDAMPKTAQSIRRLFLKRSRFVSMIRDIRAPTLVIQGVFDPIVSPNSVEWLCSLRPDWTLVQLEDTGHIPQLEAPVRTLSAIEPWLEEHLNREFGA